MMRWLDKLLDMYLTVELTKIDYETPDEVHIKKGLLWDSKTYIYRRKRIQE